MREPRRGRSVNRAAEIREACKPKRHEPLKPGKEREVPIEGLPHLQRLEVVSPTDD